MMVDDWVKHCLIIIDMDVTTKYWDICGNMIQ